MLGIGLPPVLCNFRFQKVFACFGGPRIVIVTQEAGVEVVCSLFDLLDENLEDTGTAAVPSDAVSEGQKDRLPFETYPVSVSLTPLGSVRPNFRY